MFGGHLPLRQPKLLNAHLCFSNFSHCKFYLSDLQFSSAFPGSSEARVQACELGFTIQMQLGDTCIWIWTMLRCWLRMEKLVLWQVKKQTYLALRKQQLQSPGPSASVLPGARWWWHWCFYQNSPAYMLGIIPGRTAQSGSLSLLESLWAVQHVEILLLATKNPDQYKMIPIYIAFVPVRAD